MLQLWPSGAPSQAHKYEPFFQGRTKLGMGHVGLWGSVRQTWARMQTKQQSWFWWTQSLASVAALAPQRFETCPPHARPSLARRIQCKKNQARISSPWCAACRNRPHATHTMGLAWGNNAKYELDNMRDGRGCFNTLRGTWQARWPSLIYTNGYNTFGMSCPTHPCKHCGLACMLAWQMGMDPCHTPHEGARGTCGTCEVVGWWGNQGDVCGLAHYLSRFLQG